MKITFIPNGYAPEGVVIGHPATVKAIEDEINRLTALAIKGGECEWQYVGSCTFTSECNGEFVFDDPGNEMPTICLNCGKPIKITPQQAPLLREF